MKKLDNYIACDDDTQSEIVLPCFQTVVEEEKGDSEEECFSGDAGGTGGSKQKKKKRQLRTLLDIDST